MTHVSTIGINTSVVNNASGIPFHIPTKAAPSCLSVSAAFGRQRNQCFIASQTFSIGDKFSKQLAMAGCGHCSVVKMWKQHTQCVALYCLAVGYVENGDI